MSIQTFLKLPQRALLKLIRLYQATWSPDHSHRKAYYPAGYCRFTPTCSEYSYQAIDKFGVLKGSGLAIWRILRCNPWSKGGPDPLTAPKVSDKL